jgi:lysophospholipase
MLERLLVSREGENAEIDRPMTFHFDFFKTHDGLSIRWGYVARTASNARGTVLFLNGRTEYMDKYAEVFEALSERGYEVYSLDWRGQGLSERLLADSQKGHVDDFEDYLRDLEQLLAIVQSRCAPPPFILLGHSMGGHLALRFLERHLDRFSRGVLSAPMIDIQVPTYLPRRLLRWLVDAALRRGRSDRYVFGSGPFNDRDRRFEGNPLTSDRARFQRNVDMIQRDPRLALGGVTFGWLSAALHSIDYLNAPVFARTLVVPLLMVTAGEDRIVSRRAQDAFCHKAPDCRRLNIEGARHEILVETDPRRAQFWQAFDDFTAN